MLTIFLMYGKNEMKNLIEKQIKYSGKTSTYIEFNWLLHEVVIHKK